MTSNICLIIFCSEYETTEQLENSSIATNILIWFIGLVCVATLVGQWYLTVTKKKHAGKAKVIIFNWTNSLPKITKMFLDQQIQNVNKTKMMLQN